MPCLVLNKRLTFMTISLFWLSPLQYHTIYRVLQLPAPAGCAGTSSFCWQSMESGLSSYADMLSVTEAGSRKWAGLYTRPVQPGAVSVTVGLEAAASHHCLLFVCWFYYMSGRCGVCRPQAEGSRPPSCHNVCRRCSTNCRLNHLD